MELCIFDLGNIIASLGLKWSNLTFMANLFSIFLEKLQIRPQWNFICILMGRVQIAVQNIVDLHG